MNKKSILVTGAGGYIGSHVCAALHNTGKYIIIGADCNWPNNVDPYLDNKRPDFNVCESNYNALSPLFFDVVIHLAARVQVAESMVIPSLYYDVNVRGTQHMLNRFRTNHFIFASSAGVLDPQSPYALSKLMCEHIIREELPDKSTICRFSNVAGSGGIFKQTGPVSHLVRVAAQTAAKKRSSLTIYGSDYNTPDGTCVRDYIHVVDLADGIVRLVEAGPQNNIQNFGSGCLSSNREVVEAMIDCTTPFDWSYGDRRAGDPASLIFDECSKFITPKYSLYDICRSAYDIEKETP